jgi:hypothetical protein
LFVIIKIFRHGVRSWYKKYPKETNTSVWDACGGLGQLTKAGVKQMYDFGTYFRDYYQDSIKLDDTRVVAKSTNKDRSILSAKAFFDTLFGHYNSIEINIAESRLDNVIFISL